MQTQESWGSELVSWGQPLRLRVSRALVRLRSAVLALPFTPSLPVRACVRACSLSLSVARAIPVGSTVCWLPTQWGSWWEIGDGRRRKASYFFPFSLLTGTTFLRTELPWF